MGEIPDLRGDKLEEKRDLRGESHWRSYWIWGETETLEETLYLRGDRDIGGDFRGERHWGRYRI